MHVMSKRRLDVSAIFGCACPACLIADARKWPRPNKNKTDWHSFMQKYTPAGSKQAAIRTVSSQQLGALACIDVTEDNS
jgi:hypothetical protein